MLQQYLPFTVLKLVMVNVSSSSSFVATVLTVYGIETHTYIEKTADSLLGCNSTYRLRYWNMNDITVPLVTDMKRCNSTYRLRYWNSAVGTYILICFSPACCNSTYRLRYWNISTISCSSDKYSLSCNSTYRLRYWNIIMRCQTFNLALQQYLPFTVLKRIHN